MSRTFSRICCMLILALASSGCRADTGSPTNSLEAPIPPTWTDNAPTPEATLIPQESPSPNLTAPSNSTLEPTIESSGTGSSTLAPTIEASGTGIRPAVTSRSLCDDAIFVSDVTIPDGTILAPEANFVKTWRLKNTGTCRWTISYAIGFAYGDAMSGTNTALPKSVGAGGEVEISVNMTAPKANGWYGGWWRLRNEHGDYFGDFVYVSILVSNGQETSTPFS